MTINTNIVHKTRTQVVLEALRERILSGDIAAGTPLRQSALASELNVSRIPVREALLQLESEGLVNFEPHKGATAAGLCAEQAQELFELRALIETDLLAKSIDKMTQDHFDIAQKLLDKLEASLHQPDSSNTWSSLNTAFHASLYVAANRTSTMEIVQNINSNCDRYVRLHLLHLGSFQDADKQHQQLLDFCKARDKKAACELLHQHLLGSASEIVELVLRQTK
ncbi:MAG: GntR family transcriptional regulator [Psychrobium sp.]|nr:GntR family transcriptional regulator [Psychrobium sp.]